MSRNLQPKICQQKYISSTDSVLVQQILSWFNRFCSNFYTHFFPDWHQSCKTLDSPLGVPFGRKLTVSAFSTFCRKPKLNPFSGCMHKMFKVLISPIIVKITIIIILITTIVNEFLAQTLGLWWPWWRCQQWCRWWWWWRWMNVGMLKTWEWLGLLAASGSFLLITTHLQHENQSTDNDDNDDNNCGCWWW